MSTYDTVLTEPDTAVSGVGRPCVSAETGAANIANAVRPTIRATANERARGRRGVMLRILPIPKHPVSVLCGLPIAVSHDVTARPHSEFAGQRAGQKGIDMASKRKAPTRNTTPIDQRLTAFAELLGTTAGTI